MAADRIKLCKTTFEVELRMTAQLFWILSEDLTMDELANRAGVCTTTLYRLFQGKTQSPHYKTILKIGRALGINMELSKGRVHLRVARSA